MIGYRPLAVFTRWLAACCGAVLFVTQSLSLSEVGVSAQSASQATGEPRQTIEPWQTQLQGEDLQLRRQAAIATRSLDAAVQRELLPVLIDRLIHEKDGQVRLAVLATVTDMGPAAAEAAEALAEAMRRDYGGRYNEETHQDYRAALALAAIGRPAVDVLRGLLQEEASNDRAEAAMALGRIGPEAAEATDDLIRLLEDEESRVREEVVLALGRIGESALGDLLKAVEHPAPAVRAGVIEAIGRIASADNRRSKVIQAAFSDDQAEVRAAAIRSLNSVELPLEGWQSIVLENLQHDQEVVRLEVINAVLRHPERLDAMKDELSELLHHDSDEVAQHAAFLIHELGPDAITAMLAALERDSGRVDSISHAISLIGPSAVRPLMAAIGASQPRVRQAAALALGKIRPVTPETVATLADGLDDPDPPTQRAFLESIGSLTHAGRAAAPAVQKKLGDPSASVRAKAIDVLFQVGTRDQEMVSQLTAMIGDRQPQVQSGAIDALRAMGPIGRQALPAVIAELSNESMQVQLSAAAFIGSHGSAAGDAAQPLVQMLHDENLAWRLTVVATLGQLGTAARAAFDELSRLGEDPDQQVRSAAVDAVGNLGLESETLIPYLAKVLHDEDEQVRSGGLRIVRRLGDDASVLLPDIIPLAAHEEQLRSVQRVLERIERSVTDPSSIPRLRELLEHEHVEVRRLAIRFLGLAGPAAADAIPRLQSFLTDADDETRKEAESAISKLQASGE